MAKKEVDSVVKLQIEGGKANPAPPIGPALAQHGLDISTFCDRFNKATQDRRGTIVPVEITIYKDKTFDFDLKEPPASELLKDAAGIEKGSGEPNNKKVASITREELKKVAKKKINDLNTNDIEQAMKIIEGTARNMGITIED